MSYVDGFVVPVPRKNLAAYRRMAQKAGKVWKEYGALEYKEWISDDVKVGKLPSFPLSANKRQGHEVPAAGRHDGSEVDAFRRQAPDLRWVQETGLRLNGRAAQSSDEGPRPATINVDDTHRVSGLLQAPRGARACYVMAHGAGAGMAHPFMGTIANELAERGIATLRYQFPYMERRAQRADTPQLAQATVRAAVAEASRLVPELALFAGGKSFGGRMTSQAQAASPLSGVRGLGFLGFPLHPAGRPSDERGAHLFDVQIPMLFLQGSRDQLPGLPLAPTPTGERGA